MRLNKDNTACLDVSFIDLWHIVKTARNSIIIALIVGVVFALVILAVSPPRLTLVAQITIRQGNLSSNDFLSGLQAKVRNLRKSQKLSEAISQVEWKTLPGKLIAVIPLQDVDKSRELEKRFEKVLKITASEFDEARRRRLTVMRKKIREDQEILLAIITHIKRAIFSGDYRPLMLTPLESYDALVKGKEKMRSLGKKLTDLNAFVPIRYHVSYVFKKELNRLSLPAFWFLCLLIPFTVILAVHLGRFLLNHDR